MDLAGNKYLLKQLTSLNVIVGKNGCGKSSLLKDLETKLRETTNIRYVSPERGGHLSYTPNVENAIQSDNNWLANARRKNQSSDFKQASVSQFRQLEITILRECEGKEVANFEPYVTSINTLLDNIRLVRDERSFRLERKNDGEAVTPEQISSGESELISLAIEVLAFGNTKSDHEHSILFLDEPDVHLHPDLQHRFCQFLVDAVKKYKIKVVVATHSTAFLSGLAMSGDTSMAFMAAGELALELRPIGDEYRRVLPVFGAHPLSNVFNEHPVLLLEGEDDVRIWQQTTRSSQGRVKLYPVDCGDKQSIEAHENLVTEIVLALYDNGTAFSLRDGDGAEEVLDHKPPLKRFRLACYAAENLLLTDEILATFFMDWEQLKQQMSSWLKLNPDHSRFPHVTALLADDANRKTGQIKDLRNLIVGQFFETEKPWEIIVGQALAEVDVTATTSGNGLVDYLGRDLANTLLV